MRFLLALPLLLTIIVVTSCSQNTVSPETTATESATLTATETADSALPAVYIKDGVAIAGADPVAYFTDGAYVPGSNEFTHEWSGAIWYFANAEHRDMFTSNPEQYAPQYGGFCAWAVSQGNTAPIDPEAWKIVDGKLYLNYDEKIQTKWAKDIPGNIAKADANWPEVAEK